MTTTEARPFTVGPRSNVVMWEPDREGNGRMLMWSRELNGSLYSFTHVVMPDGEVRWFVKVFNGYCGGPSFACAWDQVRSWTIRPDAAATVPMPDARTLADLVADKANCERIRTNIERVRNAVAVLDSSLTTGDLLSARYAAATITERGDAIETALLALDREAKALRGGLVSL